MVRCGWVRGLLVTALVACALADQGVAQAPGGRGGAAPQQPRVHANMLQLMRGVLYPASNVIFTVQSDDPDTFQAGAAALDIVRSVDERVRRVGGSRKCRNGPGRVRKPSDHSAPVWQREAGSGSERRLADVGTGAPRRRARGLQSGAGQERGRHSRRGQCGVGRVSALSPEVPKCAGRASKPVLAFAPDPDDCEDHQ